MKNDFIAVIDSGIGGLSVLHELVKSFPDERFLYYGDNFNAPYGNRNRQNLLSMVMRIIDRIKFYPVKAIVVACNTLSVNLIKEIGEYSAMPVVGIFPPVESEILNGHRTLLLSTVSTYGKFIKYYNKTNFHLLGLTTLVKDIESDLSKIRNIDIDNELLNGVTCGFVNEKGYYDTVILGCTHYFFVKNKISDHFQPQKTLSGIEFTKKKLSEIILNNKTSVNYSENSVVFIGEAKDINRWFYNIFYSINA